MQAGTWWATSESPCCCCKTVAIVVHSYYSNNRGIIMNFRRNLGPSQLWCWQSIYRSMIVSWVERRDEPVVVPCTLPHLYAAPSVRCPACTLRPGFRKCVGNPPWGEHTPSHYISQPRSQGTHPPTPVTTVSEHGNSLFTFGYYQLLFISILWQISLIRSFPFIWPYRFIYVCYTSVPPISLNFYRCDDVRRWWGASPLCAVFIS